MNNSGIMFTHMSAQQSERRADQLHSGHFVITWATRTRSSSHSMLTSHCETRSVQRCYMWLVCHRY